MKIFAIGLLLFAQFNLAAGFSPYDADDGDEAGLASETPESGAMQQTQEELRRPSASLVLMSAISGIAHGIVATIYARKGDSAYAKYKEADTIADAEKLWNDTVFADRISNTTACLSATSLAICAYFAYRYYHGVRRYDLEKEKMGYRFDITPVGTRDGLRVVLAYEF